MPSTIRWLGTADAVAQVSTGSIDSVDGTPADNTFTVTIGGVAISVVGTTDVNTTATALRAALNASTHPYFAAVTWSGSGGNIIGTAKYAGVPFVAALTETGTGSGAVTDFAATTANAGPNDLSTAANYSGGALPTNGDTLIIENCKAPILWNLDALAAVTLAKLWVRRTFTGLIGLRGYEFLKQLTTNYGEVFDATKADYRAEYLKVGATACVVEGNSGRIKLDQSNVQTAWLVTEGLGITADAGLPAIRLLGTNASNTLTVEGGVVGVAVGTGSEVSTIATSYIYGGSVKFSAAATLTTIHAGGGTVEINNAAGTVYNYGATIHIDAASGTITAIYQFNGETVLTGAPTITALLIENGIVRANQGGTITTLTMTGAGTIDFTRSLLQCTITNLVFDDDGGIVLAGPNTSYNNSISITANKWARLAVTSEN